MESGSPTVHGPNKLNVNPRATLAMAIEKVLWGIIENLNVFHP
jgi:hypothetical protein